MWFSFTKDGMSLNLSLVCWFVPLSDSMTLLGCPEDRPRFSVNKDFPQEAQIITGWIPLWCSESGNLNQPRAWRAKTTLRSSCEVSEYKYDTRVDNAEQLLVSQTQLPVTHPPTHTPPLCSICVVLYHSNRCHCMTCLNEVLSITVVKYDSLINSVSSPGCQGCAFKKNKKKQRMERRKETQSWTSIIRGVQGLVRGYFLN